MADSLPFLVNEINRIRKIISGTLKTQGDHYMHTIGGRLMSDHIDSRAVLWESVRQLMIKEHGKENINQFHKRTGVSLASIGRIKEQDTSVGLEIIDKIAATFGLAGWQLLVPGFDPFAPPVLRAAKNGEAILYEKLLTAARELVASEPSPPPYTKGTS